MFLSKYENVYICAVLLTGEFGEVYRAHFIKFGLTYTVAVKTLKGYCLVLVTSPVNYFMTVAT